MKNFYKLAILIAMLALGPTAGAAWNSNLSQNLLISEEGMPNQSYTLCAATPQGDMWVSWLSWEGMNAYLKLQLLDKDGNTLLEEGGIYVSKHPTPTWSSGYDLKSTADGDAVIIYCDKRNGQWHAYLYRVGKDGEMKWGKDGVAIVEADSKETCLDPKLCVTKSGNILAGFGSMLTGADMTKIYKFNPDGTPAWGSYISIPETNATFTYNITATGDDSAFVSYFTAGGEYEMMKYTANGEPAWENVVKIDDSGLVSVTTEPSVAVDNNDGILFGWNNKSGQFSTSGFAQHFDKNGKKLWQDNLEVAEAPQVAITPAGDCYIAYRINIQQNVALSRITADGKEQWTATMLADDTYKASVYGTIPCAEGMMVIYRNASDYDEAVIEYSVVGENGVTSAMNVTVSDAPGDKGKGDIAVTENQVLVVWEDNASNNSGGCIYAQNIAFKPASIDAVISQAGKVSITGVGNCLTCTSDTPFDGASLTVTALDGTTRLTCKLNDGDTTATVPVETIGSGIYAVTIITSSGTHTEKIMLK